MIRTPMQTQGGFSLVETAVGLAITALLATLLLSLLPLGNRVVNGERQQQELAQAEQALLGYMQAHGRLPAAIVEAGQPWLPVADLGLPSRMRIRYQVHPSLSASPGDLFHPLLPDTLQHPPAVNALDFCMRLLLNQRGRVTMAGLGMPVAYYMGHAGFAGHTLTDSASEWSDTGQILPGTPSRSATVAAGPGELASRLACPDRLGRTQGSAQGAMAAHSAHRMTEFNLEFREFDITIAETVVAQARTLHDLAIYALAEAITNEAIAITLLASGWPPDGSSMAAGAKLLANSVNSIRSAASELKSAIEALDEANEGLVQARRNRDHVRGYRDKVQALMLAASRNAIAMDNAGLHQ